MSGLNFSEAGKIACKDVYACGELLFCDNINMYIDEKIFFEFSNCL